MTNFLRHLHPIYIAWLGLILFALYYGGQELGAWLLDMDPTLARQEDWLFYTLSE